MVQGSMNIIKYLMFFFNFLFWLSGLALIIIGAIVRNKYGDYLAYADNKFANVSVFIIIIGVIVFIVGFLGCCGAIKENYCMVTTFSVLLGIIFLLEIIAGAVGFAYKKDVEKYATKAFNRSVDSYDDKNQPGAKELLDWLQREFECCSAKKSSRRNGTCPSTSLPTSCYPKGDCSKDQYTKDCKESFIDFINNHLIIVGAVALAFAFVQILGIVFACCLMKAIKSEYQVVA